MPRSDLVALDKRHVWHPYTSMGRYRDQTDPLVVVRAAGSRLWDADGKSYLDGNSSWWVAVLGHGHPRLVSALTEQARSLAHVSLAGTTHEPAVRLAEELVRVAPAGLEHVFYSDDGSTAVEAALKMALGVWRNEGQPERRRIVALEGAFHGDTLGAASLGGLEVFHRGWSGGVVECVHAPVPDGEVHGGVRGEDERDGRSDARSEGYRRAFDAMHELVDAGAASIAAVIVEPLLQGAAGMRTYPARYLTELAAHCRAHGILVIADEVFTGYGRTGTMWACEQAQLTPDILCLAKGLSGGMLPMAATLANERVFGAFLGEPERAFWHGHSFTGNPLGARVAREVLAIYRDERIVEQAQPKMRRIRQAFKAMGAIPGVLRWRALGMMGCVELASAGGYLGRGGWRVYDEARARGAYLRPLGDTVYVAPPLNIADDELDELLAIVAASLRAAL
ncbi:MAG: adenosylmethionine--8-amino-7-oxononanoate transaminase [Myxococcales bacterium]|nr:adenosylmethionine--8-amino-7-oxononanoate transaminase [Myxococcales bacterium]